jgi:hypothetical protein
MLVVTAVIGMLVLGGLAVWVGLIEGSALDGAWRRVATARQSLAQREMHLDKRESRLIKREHAMDVREESLARWECRLRREQEG